MAAFYFDRGLYWWGKFVENKMDEAEQAIRRSMKNRKGTDTFVMSQRIAIYNRLLGLDDKAAYKDPAVRTKVTAPQGKPAELFRG